MSNETDADRLAVLAVIKAGYAAWEANDVDEFVAGYLDDATVVQPGTYKGIAMRSGTPWRLGSRDH